MLTESPVFTAVLYLKFVAVQEQHLKCMLQMLDHELKYGCKAPQILSPALTIPTTCAVHMYCCQPTGGDSSRGRCECRV